MPRSSKARSIFPASRAAVAVAALLAFGPSLAAAQGDCAQHTVTLLNTTVSCVNEPWRDRASDVETFHWKGHDYMIFNRGNELSIFQVDNPAKPVGTDSSHFELGTRGDSDYDLLDFDVCDDCRYGVFRHKLARTVVFDLGIGATPKFGAFAKYAANDAIAGGYTFLRGGRQYLITGDFPDGCRSSGLYLVNGVNQIDLLECLEIGGSAVKIKGLNTITDDDHVLYLYAAEQAGPVHVFRFDDTGVDKYMDYVTSPAGMFGRLYELSIDTTNRRAASADYYGARVDIWDLSVPSSPSFRYSIDVKAGSVSLTSPSKGAASTLLTYAVGWPDSTHVYSVDDTGFDEAVDPEFFHNDALDHNPEQGCAYEAGGAVSRDGSVLFLSRYAVHQVFDLSDCLTPTPPNADLAISPTELFPGDTVEVRDTSTGRADRWALWVTEGSDPSGTAVAGSSVMSSGNPRTISYTIPAGLAYGQDFSAHVTVESDDFDPPDDYDEKSKPITVDLRPQVSITVEPETVVVSESVDLTAIVNGGSPTSFNWEVRAPGVAVGEGDTYSGQSVSSVSLNVSGLWHFDVVATFPHDDPDGGPGAYQATDAYEVDVKSVAAGFYWTPAEPLHTQEITLDGSPSKPSSGLTYTWQVSLGGIVVRECLASTVKTCTIPADTLDPDFTYDVSLTVSNGSESSTAEGQMFVGNGNVQPVITWSPSTPDIGEAVTFRIEGVPGDLDSASWNMGGTGCEGVDSTPTCTPSLWKDCKAQSYKYSSSGTKTVTLSVVVGGNTFTADPVQVPVQPSGSCYTPTPAPCTYSISPSSVEFGPSGGEATARVSTQSGCSWSVSSATPWITISAPTTTVSGSGGLRFRALENTGPYRTGSVIAGGRALTVNQRAPAVPATFNMSNTRPDIGETVTFSADPILEVASWDFGEANCEGNDPAIDCRWMPGNACNTVQWSFTSKGPKNVTMRLKDGRSKTRNPYVQNSGQCCLVDGRPNADIAMSADEVYIGETIFFTDESEKSVSEKSVPEKAATFSWSPHNPEIGESVSFTLEDIVGDIEKATWDFGGTGCDGAAAVQECIPSLWNKCETMPFSYDSSGDKSVTVTVEIEGGGSETLGPLVVAVANAGECPGGGGGGGPVCGYSLSPTSADYSHSGGSGSFNVTTTEDCEWNPNTSSSWVHIGSGGGFGSGSVEYSVDANPGTRARSTTIYVEGRQFRVSQSGYRDTAPTEWRWTITRVLDAQGETVDENYYSSAEQHISYLFTDPGRYRVTLTAINCYGDNSTHQFVDILEAPVENFVVAAAISGGGAHGTRWESDFRFFNPCEDNLNVSLFYQPDNQDNVLKLLSENEFPLAPGETVVYPNAREVFEPDDGETINGSILIDSVSASGCKVLSVSRTFNDTPEGTLGIYVPTMPVTSVGVKSLNLTGLISNSEYRSNLRLVNHGDAEAWVRITLFDKSGDTLNDGKSVKVKAHSTKQINEVAPWAGVEASLSQFTVVAEVLTAGAVIDGFATITDNISGDSISSSSSHPDESIVWLPGVVYAPGKNETFWQTDVWIHNPALDDPWLTSQATYVDGGKPSLQYLFSDDWPAIPSQGMRRRLDIAGSILDELGVDSTSGYLIFEGLNGDSAPQVVARTFTSDESGGTFGLHLPPFGVDDLLRLGDIGYIVGVSNSADPLSGFRTNLGLLATGKTVEVAVTFFYPDGSTAPEVWNTTVWAGQLKQVNNVFKKFGLGNETVTGTFKIEVVSGDGLIVYATETDNMTGDSIFIPAQQKYVNPAQ